MTRAAQRLHLAQPALSQAIAQLERELGVALLVRRARGVEPTEAGRAFLREARAALAAAERAEVTARGFSHERSRVLELALPFSLFSRTERLLSELRASHPEVVVRPHQLDFTELLAELRAGTVDAEMVCPPPPAAPDLEIQPISSERVFILLSASHRLAAERELVFDQISDECFCGPHPAMPAWWADVWFLTARRGRRPRVSDDTARTAEETLLVIASGRGIVATPAFVVEQLDAIPGVVAVPLIDIEPVVLGVARRADDRRPAVQALFDAARGVYEAPPLAAKASFTSTRGGVVSGR